ncbi:hypothetical protein AJOOGB_AJOOGB_04340, partial [Dysosmobacter welbionis]
DGGGPQGPKIRREVDAQKQAAGKAQQHVPPGQGFQLPPSSRQYRDRHQRRRKGHPVQRQDQGRRRGPPDKHRRQGHPSHAQQDDQPLHAPPSLRMHSAVSRGVKAVTSRC